MKSISQAVARLQPSMEEHKQQFQSAQPFPHLELPKVIAEEDINPFMECLVTEPFEHKDADLFSLNHTQDFASSRIPELQELREYFVSKEFIDFMESVTGLKLSREKIDVMGSLYEDTDYLLCHDDQLDSRKIAFLLYLTTCESDDGGALAFFDENGTVVKRIHPKAGTLAFFEVSDKSFHSVEEVIGEAQRFAVGGWFHAQ